MWHDEMKRIRAIEGRGTKMGSRGSFEYTDGDGENQKARQQGVEANGEGGGTWWAETEELGEWT